MLRNSRVQMIAMLAVGGIFGYGAASGKLDVFRSAKADPLQQSQADGLGQVPEAGLSCCPEGSPTGLLVAAAAPRSMVLGESASPRLASHAATQAEEAIVFEVLLPANAELSLDDTKTTGSGERRTFQTPPLRVGGRFNYTVKATAGGKSVTRQFHISHGGANSIDLRPDFLAGGAGKAAATALTQKPADSKKPNILFIMGDDIGIMQPGCYHRGLMVGETPNIDRIAREGGQFMDYYAMQSCTSGRCAFFTGMVPLRVGLTVPQLPGSPAWLRPGTPTIARALLDLGYTTGQFGKNHLGDHAEALPTANGFQEYWGYLYHLDAMQQVSFPDINKTPTEQGIAPPGLNTPIKGLTPPAGSVDPRTHIALIPPRPVLLCKSSDGTLANQEAKDEGPLTLDRSKTVDEEISSHVIDWLDRNDPKKTNKPFFCWYNPARMHITTVLSDKYLAMLGVRGGKDWGVNEAGMKQMDDNIGYVLDKLEKMGELDNTIIVFTTDNGAEAVTFPDGGVTPFKGQKGQAWEGGYRAPCVIRWPGHVKPGTLYKEMFASYDWMPTFVEIAGGPKGDELKKQVMAGTYPNFKKTLLEGVNQIDYLTGKTDKSARDTFFYYSGATLSAVRYKNWKFYYSMAEPGAVGWVMPLTNYNFTLVQNIKRDPFEQAVGVDQKTVQGWGGALASPGTAFVYDWNMLPIGQMMALRHLESFEEFPPMQSPPSYNLAQVQEEIRARRRAIANAGHPSD